MATIPLTVFLSDPGGRDLHGMSWRLIAPDGAVAASGRIGQARLVPPGEYTLELPVEPGWREAVVVPASGELQVDLGRLACLCVKWTRPDGAPTAGLPIVLQQGILKAHGRVGTPLEIRPGAWTLHLDAADAPAPRELTLRGGRLTELELGEAPRPGSDASLRAALREELRGALHTLRSRVAHPRQEAAVSREVAPLLCLRDALGHALKVRLTLRGPAGAREVWTGEAPPRDLGALAVEWTGCPGVALPAARGADLGALGAVDVHIKDPAGYSLRGAPVELEHRGTGLRREGRAGYPIDVAPGRWVVRLPLVPGSEQEIDAPPGRITVADFGVCGWIEVEPTPALPEGTHLPLYRAGEAAPLGALVVGEELLVSMGQYRVHLPDGVQELTAHRRRKYRPSVTLRSAAEPLPMDAGGEELAH